ncbi:unnamed protein product [marine sediment metagenome]|uniref:Uncharacterized protein n=1 Tax=marine sediment metagenome TaxID=412755 RepID=X1Q2H0_9ZZZZ
MSDKQELEKAVTELKKAKENAGEKLSKAVDIINQRRQEQAGK